SRHAPDAAARRADPACDPGRRLRLRDAIRVLVAAAPRRHVPALRPGLASAAARVLRDRGGDVHRRIRPPDRPRRLPDRERPFQARGVPERRQAPVLGADVADRAPAAALPRVAHRDRWRDPSSAAGGLTRAILRSRVVVLVSWGVVLVCGGVASTQLTSLLTNSFAVPGSGSDHASKLLASHFGERPEGSFIVVFPVRHSSDAALRRRLDHRLARAARRLPGGHALPLRPGGGLFYGEVATRLDFQDAKRYTERLRRAFRATTGRAALVTGQPAIQHDLDPILASDLHRGELVAAPFALIVLLALFGLSLAVAIPFVVAACTVTGTLAAVWAIAHAVQTTSFVANLVTLIGFGLAVDYSLLIVHRFREELSHTDAVDDAVVRTMATAGRAVVLSGTTVAISLGMLILVPVPFIRSLGVAGALVPLVSIAAALTLQPVLLAMLGGRVLAKPVFGEAARRFWQGLAPW